MNASRVKIAYVFNHAYFLGGGEISLYELIRSLDRKRYEPFVIVPDGGEIEDQIKLEGIRVYRSAFPRIGHTESWRCLSAVARMARLMKEQNSEIIHANGSRVCLYAGVVGRTLNIPVIWHVRETVQDIALYDALLSLLAKRIICVSRSVQDKRFSRFGRRVRKKTAVVYNGVDTNKFQRKTALREITRKELGVKKEQTLFGLIGNIVPLKGQDFFLKGLARAKEMHSDVVAKALLIGRCLDPDFHRLLHHLIHRLGLIDDVILLNHTNRVLDILSALDVFVLPSNREGFSRSLLEAMSSGLPVLATRISEIEEAVIEGENALLIDFGDVETMAASIIRLCEDRALRKSIGDRNRMRAKEEFELQSHARSMEALYARLIHPGI